MIGRSMAGELLDYLRSVHKDIELAGYGVPPKGLELERGLEAALAEKIEPSAEVRLLGGLYGYALMCRDGSVPQVLVEQGQPLAYRQRGAALRNGQDFDLLVWCFKTEEIIDPDVYFRHNP